MIRGALRLSSALVLILTACDPGTVALNPDTAPVASVDRFQDSFGKLFKRSGPAFDPTNVSKVVPAANAPIDMDNFLVKSFSATGQKITYYSLDIIQPVPMDGWVIPGQLPVVDKLPGDEGYSDFVLVSEVTTKEGFVPNSLTSKAEIDAAVKAGTITVKKTDRIENWSFVPKGTTAKLKFQGKVITGFRAWVKGQVGHYLEFEKNLKVTSDGKVPTSPIIVIFKNDMDPGAGFAAETDGQTHNVVATVPGDPGYSSYWAHSVGKLSGFNGVNNLSTANANIAAANVGVIVNCPVVAP